MMVKLMTLMKTFYFLFRKKIRVDHIVLLFKCHRGLDKQDYTVQKQEMDWLLWDKCNFIFVFAL